MKRINNKNILYYLLIQIVLMISSLSGVCSKLASKQSFLSPKFILFYGMMVVILGVYAILWQQCLKRIPLTTAYCCSGVSLFWGIVWGALFFRETIKWNMIVGCLVVIVGVLIVVLSEKKPEDGGKEHEQ